MSAITKAALVTGGGQGIGKCIVARLVEDGYGVLIADTDKAAGQETAARYDRGGIVRFIPTDVADETAVHAAVAAAIAEFGRIDALVNNAATSAGGTIETTTLADWQRVLAVDLTGPFLCAKHAAPHLRAHRGAIVNIGSTRALMSEANTFAYTAAKGGIVALTHALAVSLGPEVRANCICPGWIDTRDWRRAGATPPAPLKPADHAQHPAGRVGRPEDIADLVAYLLSDRAGFITGQDFVVDGGMTIKMIYVP